MAAHNQISRLERCRSGSYVWVGRYMASGWWDDGGHERESTSLARTGDKGRWSLFAVARNEGVASHTVESVGKYGMLRLSGVGDEPARPNNGPVL